MAYRPGIIRYLGEVGKEAWSASLDVAQAVLFVALTLIGGTIAMFPSFAAAHNFSQILSIAASWKGAAIVLGAVVVSRLLMAPYRMHERLMEQLQHERKNSIRVNIKAILFDNNLATELYIDVTVANPGVPTVLRDWATEIKLPDGRFYQFKPRHIHGDRLRPHPIKGVINDDLSQDPVQTGESRQVRLIFTISDTNAREFFGITGALYKVLTHTNIGTKLEAERIY